ncbi:MAG: IS1096 element passenger TnpR family protein [Fermentimonas sp.]|jgi:hypothetical protein
MIFNFIIISDEVENFKRVINIDGDDTFLNLYKAIIKSTNYSDKEMASFYICDEKWRKRKEITLVEMDAESDEDSLIMSECILSDYLEDEGQKLMFVFDYINDRALYMELHEIIPGKNLKKPTCVRSEGDAPQQVVDLEDTTPVITSTDVGENFYGDESFDIDELDIDGFEGLDDEIADTDSIE